MTIPMITDLSTLQPSEMGVPLSAVQLRSRLALIQSVMRDVMQHNVDYGVIPGTDKPSLYKPGAEKLCVTFRLSAGRPTVESIQDHTGDVRYRVEVPIIASDGTVLAVGVGECSTGEEKYRFRRPVHENEYLAAPEDQRREKWTRSGDVWRQVRVNPADVANTVLKMAHKRAYVHAVIMATAAGALFTQDIEDLPEGIEAGEAAASAKSAPEAPKRKAPSAPAGAGTTVQIRIKDITKKEGTGDKGPWVKTTVEATTGHKYGTFDTQVAAIAREAKDAGHDLSVTYTEGKYGRDILALDVVGREPGAAG